MLSVSDDFKAVLKNPSGESTREVSYKRRVWDASQQEFVWETDWTVVENSNIVGVSAITVQLDSEQLNEFKVSNVTIMFKNNTNEWREDNPGGIFGQDGDSPLYPYEPFWTKFRVRVAMRLPDDSDEYVTMFTGVAVEYTFASNDQVQVTVQGLESLLINANAEDVSTTVTNELFAGPDTEFTTANPGVGIIDEVSVAGIKKVPGTDYEISDLDSPSLGAKITFSTPQSAVRISYRYWHQNQRVEELISDLLTAAGIESANQDVDPVIFSNPIFSSFTIDSAADWLAGTGARIDFASVPGSIGIDIFDAVHSQTFDDFNSPPPPTWTPEGNLTWSTPASNFRFVKSDVTKMGVSTAPLIVIGVHLNAQIGKWSFSMSEMDASADKVIIGFAVAGFLYFGTSPFYPYALKGNFLRVQATPYSGGPDDLWELFINDVLVASAYFNAPAGVQTVEMWRYPSGLSKIFCAGQLVMQGQSIAVVPSNTFGFASGQGAFSSQHDFDDIVVPSPVFTAEWSSPTFDLSVGVINIGHLFADHQLGPDSIITYSTRTSTNGSSWDSWLPLAANGQVRSAVKRYIQVRVQMTHDAESYYVPIVNSIRVEFQTQTATISLAKFTGKTVYEAIQSLGQFSNYEWGFSPTEVFFFRQKTVDKDPDEIIVREGDIVSVSGMTTGYDRVYSEVRVTYGSFTAVLRASGQEPRDALARFGVRVFSLDVADIVIGNDSDIASGVAKIFFNQLTKPRRRFKIACRFLPYLELSDTILVSFDQNKQRKLWHFGDETVDLGDNNVTFWGPGEQILSGMFAKIIGVRNDLFRYMTEFDLEEVL